MAISIPALVAFLTNRSRPASLESVLDIARQTKYDGALTLHFRGGVAQKVEAGRPAQIDLLTDSEIRPTLSSNTT